MFFFYIDQEKPRKMYIKRFSDFRKKFLNSNSITFLLSNINITRPWQFQLGFFFQKIIQCRWAFISLGLENEVPEIITQLNFFNIKMCLKLTIRKSFIFILGKSKASTSKENTQINLHQCRICNKQFKYYDSIFNLVAHKQVF